jgi:hypothetical protein
MTDTKRRSHKHDDFESLVARITWAIRVGELDLQDVELASSLGHPLAIAVVGSRPLLDWSNWTIRENTYKKLIEEGKKPLVVLHVSDLAETRLSEFESRYPNDARPRQAIQAARRWAKEPTEKNRTAAYAAANAAYTAAYAAAAAANAANAAAAAYAAANAAAHAAYAAAYATANAAAAAADDAANDRQKHLLAEYLIGLV